MLAMVAITVLFILVSSFNALGKATLSPFGKLLNLVRSGVGSSANSRKTSRNRERIREKLGFRNQSRETPIDSLASCGVCLRFLPCEHSEDK